MDAIVFGATGFIGRSLVAELLGRGQRVAAAVRNDTLTPWLDSQGVDTGGLTVVPTSPGRSRDCPGCATSTTPRRASRSASAWRRRGRPT
ncbi:NAD-dependent epimerase/dehydratase family protein [Microtetraspora sp. AC03309]|uniref:NAD-dependent epimerase/dehydratase family protein n=1 Tax=Microtetraspora sp. AC03309 TaxID=2779376 RepID=UPI001E653CEC|nr:NAD-dependent epimerase/dehydratase family protein [Microtetraspora sp. AC03309]